MVISNNLEVSNKDFESLLNQTLLLLSKESKTNTEKYLKLLGNKLEDEVFEIMNHCASNTPFENTIELVSGQKFPDIIANNYYGVEVKSTKQNHWKTTGNSVLESTRVDQIQKIYMLFGKMYNPIEFKCRPYEHCLSEVIVTHSPRYAIDMELRKGVTIFDKIAIDYNELRKHSNPIKPFKEYYRSKLKEGQELWWLENEEYQPDSLIFKVWNTLSRNEKKFYQIKGFVLFPEILGNQQTKFDNFTLWLSVKNRVLCPNVRDIFTSGGRESIEIEGEILKNVPKAIIKLFKNIDKIVAEFHVTELEIFEENWKTEPLTLPKAKKLWIGNVCKAASKIYDFQSFNINFYLSRKLE